MDQVPKEAKIITMLLSTLSVPECEPRIISFLMEFMFRYSTEVFKEALALSEHAKKSTISKEELKLAVSINSRILHSKILSRAFLAELADRVNSKPLKKIENSETDENYFKIPSSQACVLNSIFKVTSVRKRN